MTAKRKRTSPNGGVRPGKPAISGLMLTIYW